jgi:hypothetical protein
VTAAPHPIQTARPWRRVPVSPLAGAEIAVVILLALIFMGVAAAHARAAVRGAQRNAAITQIKVIASTISVYGLDHSGYTGLTPAALEQEYGFRAKSATSGTIEITGTSASGYCVQVKDGDWYAGQRGPSGAVETSRTPIC